MQRCEIVRAVPDRRDLAEATIDVDGGNRRARRLTIVSDDAAQRRARLLRDGRRRDQRAGSATDQQCRGKRQAPSGEFACRHVIPPTG
ncbi:MAG: hypothetical protein ACTHM8_08970 [Sphingomonas sp.]